MTTSSQVNNISIIRYSALSMALAVILGAMAAHYLKTILPEDQILSFNTGVKYHVYHTLALFILTTLNFVGFKFSKWVFWLIIVGIILFSGSIYLLSTLPAHGIELVRYLGPITPLGGLCFISAWSLLGITISKN